MWYSLLGLGALVVLALVFGVGILLGRATAGNAPRPWLRRAPALVSGYGTLGTLKEIGAESLIVQSRDGKMNTVLFDKNTRIERNRQKISVSDLKNGDYVAVIGAPNEHHQIKARWIQALPVNHLPAGWRKTPLPGELQ